MADNLRWFWIDLPDLRDAPCGAVGCNWRGSIVRGAPVLLKRFRNWPLNSVIQRERSRGRLVRWSRLESSDG